jgi:hypothetical protein
MKNVDDVRSMWDDEHLLSCPFSPLFGCDRHAPQEQVDRLAEADWVCLFRAAVRAGADPQEASKLVEAVLLRARENLGGGTTNLRLRARLHSWMVSFVENAATKASLPSSA